MKELAEAIRAHMSSQATLEEKLAEVLADAFWKWKETAEDRSLFDVQAEAVIEYLKSMVVERLVESVDVPALKSLIEEEAALLGLSFEAAVERERSGTLPATPVGTDLSFLIRMLLAVTA